MTLLDCRLHGYEELSNVARAMMKKQGKSDIDIDRAMDDALLEWEKVLSAEDPDHVQATLK